MSVFAEIKNSLPARKVLEHFLGPSRYSFCCPFHEDRTPSLSAHGPAIRCFGCQWSGDIFRFVEAHSGVGRGEALQILADLAGVILPAPRHRSQARSNINVTREHIRRESREIEGEIVKEVERAAGLAWRQAWDARDTESVWDHVELGATFDRYIEMMKGRGDE